MTSLTQSRIKELLHYNPGTGQFIWANPLCTRVKRGDIAGCTGTNGYRTISVEGIRYPAHRLAWLYVYGKFPDSQIDHVNGVENDNRIANLRDVTCSENAQNTKMSKNNSSGINGIYWHKAFRRWMPRISVNGKRVYLGSYKSLELAGLVREEAEVKYGYHPNHGKSPMQRSAWAAAANPKNIKEIKTAGKEVP